MLECIDLFHTCSLDDQVTAAIDKLVSSITYNVYWVEIHCTEEIGLAGLFDISRMTKLLRDDHEFYRSLV